jgi:hypothetical protein
MSTRSPHPWWLMLLTSLALLGCPAGDDDDVADDDVTDDDDDDTTAVDPIAVPHTAGCENINPLHCAMPFPSDRFLAEDASTTTGYRLGYTQEVIPEGLEGFDFTPWERLDGHSPVTQIMTLFESPADLTAADAAAFDDLGRSLDDDSPTVILDLDTGERVAHFAENDLRAQSDSETVLYLRLSAALAEDHAFVVAIRGLVDEDGAAFEPSDAFRALRDDIPTDSDEIEQRRAGFEDAFAALADAGVDRSGLQQAWTFHTASGGAIRRDMLHIRADALDRLGPDGIGCTVSSVEDDYGGDGRTWRRIRGTYTVPSYVDSPDPPTRFVRGVDDLPEYVDDYEVGFTIIVPQSLVGEAPVAGPLVTFGHGLLGTAEGTISMGSIRQIADETGTILVGTDWAGMSSEDVPTVGSALGDPANFVSMAERLQQGMVNQIALTRTFAGVCSDIPELVHEDTPLVDPTRLNYVGVSQGGIYGGTLMTLSPDIDRGCLLVNGVVFPFMMERSIDYAPYLPLFELAWPERLDQALLLPVAQHLWDASEPSGYLPHLSTGLDGIGPKEVLSIAVVNDAQVPNLSTNQAMRMVDVPVVEGSALEPWGFDVLPAPVTGSALVYIDMGDRDIPEGNVAPEYDDGGHSAVGTTAPALTMIMSFFDTGEVPMPCDGICDPD